MNMSQHNKALELITHTQSTAKSDVTPDDIRDIMNGVTAQLPQIVGRALEKSLPDTVKAEITAKRKAISDKYGESVGNSLYGQALDELYNQIADKTPTTNSSTTGAERLTANAADLPDDHGHYGSGAGWLAGVDLSGLPKE